MNAGDWLAIVAPSLVILSWLAILSWKLGSINTKVESLWRNHEVMWDFQMRRAQTELLAKGMATVNSPLQIKEEVVEKAAKLFGDEIYHMKAYFAKFGRHLTESEIRFELEKTFGRMIYKTICIPHAIAPEGLDDAACLLIASEVLKRT